MKKSTSFLWGLGSCCIVTALHFALVQALVSDFSIHSPWNHHQLHLNLHRKQSRSVFSSRSLSLSAHKKKTSLKSQYFPSDVEGEDTSSSSSASTFTNNGNGVSSTSNSGGGQSKEDVEALLELLVPFSAPFLAFFTYEYIAEGFSFAIDTFSSNNWLAVDGGALQAKIIAPAINGVVIPATTLLYATLTSTTISTLRQRQVDIRKAINNEAGELRYLCQLVQSYPPTNKVRDKARAYLMQYTKRILMECQPHVSSADDVIDPRRGMETELNDFLLLLHRGYDEDIPSHLADESLAAIGKLREQRLQRLSALQSTYPSLHYVTLALLALAECAAFLMETNQDLLFFLTAFQLKLLWSILVGTFAACFTVFYDLLSPFSGSYQISASVDQIHGIRRILAVNVFNDPEENKHKAATAGVGDIVQQQQQEREQSVLSRSASEQEVELTAIPTSNDNGDVIKNKSSTKGKSSNSNAINGSTTNLSKQPK